MVKDKIKKKEQKNVTLEKQTTQSFLLQLMDVHLIVQLYEDCVISMRIVHKTLEKTSYVLVL